MRPFNSPLSCRINSECTHDRVSPQSAMFLRGSKLHGPSLHLICCDAWPIRYHYGTDDCMNMITRMHYFKFNRMENDNILLSHTYVTLQIGTHIINKKLQQTAKNTFGPRTHKFAYWFFIRIQISLTFRFSLIHIWTNRSLQMFSHDTLVTAMLL